MFALSSFPFHSRDDDGHIVLSTDIYDFLILPDESWKGVDSTEHVPKGKLLRVIQMITTYA